jgi:hypothetical protein
VRSRFGLTGWAGKAQNRRFQAAQKPRPNEKAALGG